MGSSFLWKLGVGEIDNFSVDFINNRPFFIDIIDKNLLTSYKTKMGCYLPIRVYLQVIQGCVPSCGSSKLHVQYGHTS